MDNIFKGLNKEEKLKLVEKLEFKSLKDFLSDCRLKSELVDDGLLVDCDDEVTVVLYSMLIFDGLLKQLETYYSRNGAYIILDKEEDLKENYVIVNTIRKGNKVLVDGFQGRLDDKLFNCYVEDLPNVVKQFAKQSIILD